MATKDEYNAIRARMADFADGLQRSMQSATCDFEIVCGGISFQVHRLVLCLHSSYFKRVCEPPSKEGTERRIVLHEDPIPAVRALVQYFYEFAYDNPMRHVEQSDISCLNPRNELEAHAQVLVLADKYDIPNLHRLALSKLDSTLENCENSTTTDVADLVAATQYIYQHAPSNEAGKSLRTSVIELWRESRGFYLQYVKEEKLNALLEELPNFAADLISGLSGQVIGVGLGCDDVGE